MYEIAADLGCNVIAFGHTADDFCEALLRNTMFTGKLSALPPVTHSRNRDYRLIRPLVFVTEDITTAYARSSRRAGGALRLFAADRHGAAGAARHVRRTGAGAPATSRKPCFRPWGTWIPAGCWIRVFWIWTAMPREPETQGPELFPIVTEL